MRSCLVHMQVRGEHVQGMVALPKARKIFVQDFLGKFGILAHSTHILTVADLDDDFVEQLFLFSRPYLFVVVGDPSVIAHLLRVVLFKCLVKELVIDLLYRLIDIGDIQMRSAAVHVVCREASVVVGKTAISKSYAYTSYYKIHLLCFCLFGIFSYCE